LRTHADSLGADLFNLGTNSASYVSAPLVSRLKESSRLSFHLSMILLIVTFAFVSALSTVYVSSRGSDSALCGASLQPGEACATLSHAVAVALQLRADVVALAPAERFTLSANASVFLTRNLTLTTAASSWPVERAVLVFVAAPAKATSTFLVNDTSFVVSNVDVRDSLLVGSFVTFGPMASLEMVNCSWAGIEFEAPLLFGTSVPFFGDDLPRSEFAWRLCVSLTNVLFDCDLVVGDSSGGGSLLRFVGLGVQEVALANVGFHVACNDSLVVPRLVFFDSDMVRFEAKRVRTLGRSTMVFRTDGPTSISLNDILFDGTSVLFQGHHPLTNVSVVDSAFVNQRAVALSAKFTDRSDFNHSAALNDCSVLVQNSTFRDIRNGGAIEILFDLDVAPAARVLVENCEVRNVSGGLFGGVSVSTQAQPSSMTVAVSKCLFVGVSADSLLGVGGALSVDSSDPVGFGSVARVIVANSVFKNCIAPDGLALWVGSAYQLTISRCAFENHHSDARGRLIDVRAAELCINDTTVLGAPSLASLLHAPRGGPPRIDLNLTNVTFSCTAGWRVLAAQEASSDSGDVKTDVWCERCPAGAYNLAPQSISVTKNAPDANESIGCHACPLGSQVANCSGAHVGAAKDFWAPVPLDFNATTELAFVECPPHTCCGRDTGCSSPDECEHHRTGTLCGACEPGFTHSLSGCVEESVCTPTRVWASNAAVMLVCFLIALYKSKKPKARETDGSFAIAIAFAGNAQIVLSECVLTAHTSVADQTSAFKEFIGSVLASISGVILPQSLELTLCPLERMSSLDRLLVTAMFPVYIFASWALVALALFAIDRRQRRQRHKQLDSELSRSVEGDAALGVPAQVRSESSSSLGFRLAVSALMLYDFSLFSLLSTTLSLLSTIDVPGVGCRLWKAGDVECSAVIQGGAAVAFVVVLTLPAVFALIQRRWPRSVFGAAVALVHQSPMREATSWYNIVLIGRRAVMAAAFALFQDKDVRAISVRSILVVSFALHMQLLPYATTTANRLESASLLSLVLVSSLQQMVSSFEAVTIIQSSVLTLTFVGLFGTLAWKKLGPKIAEWRARIRQR